MVRPTDMEDKTGEDGVRLAQPVPLAWWQDRRVALGAAAALVLLAIACAWLAFSAGVARERMALLESRADEGFLMPASSVRSLRVALGGGVALDSSDTAERVELRIDARSNRFNLFRVAIERDDGTGVLHFDRLQRDTNGELRFAINSTLLPPGRYTIRIEGFTWRGATEPVGTVSLRR